MAFESITDEKIDGLLSVSKRVVNPNSRAKLKDGHQQFNYRVRTIGDVEYEMTLYTRQNLRDGMDDDFSCGLCWNAPNGETLTLVRYNGSSHSHPNHLEKEMLNLECHIHRATEKYIRANKKPEGFAQATNRYQSLRGALHCMVSDCNIAGISTFADEPFLPLDI